MARALIMVTRMPPGEEPEAEPVVVELLDDGGALLTLDDGEVLEIDRRNVDELRSVLAR